MHRNDPALDPPYLAVAAAAAHRIGAPNVAVDALLTDGDWYDGMDPATAWALTWLGEQGARATPSADDAVRVGYRVGRLLLGEHVHPDLAAPHRCDVLACHLYDATARHASPELFDRLPPDLCRVLTLCSFVLIGRRPPPAPVFGTSTETDPEAATFAAALRGFVLALVEQMTLPKRMSR